MKFLKLSLAASVALGAFSTASFAQPLEDAIRDIDVSGYLRYRFNSDYYDYEDTSANRDTHRWKAVADFKAPVADNTAFNFGVLYNNEDNTVHGSYPGGGVGSGLGSGKDGSFGVSTFNAVFTPDSTATTVILGKQRLATPVTNAGDDDRGTGILVLNSDLENITFAAGAFDSFSIDDVQQGYGLGGNTGGSVTKPLYALAGLYNFDTAYGNFGVQLWGFYIQDIVDGLGVLDLSWNDTTFNASIKYAIASLNNDSDSVLGVVNGTTDLNGNLNSLADKSDIQGGNDLFLINLGADFTKEYDLPLDIRLGYVMNFQDGTAVTLNDDGNLFTDTWAGAIWWQDNSVGFSTSALLNRPFRFGGSLPAGSGANDGYSRYGSEQSVGVFYAALGYKMIENRLRIGLDFAFGNNKFEDEKGEAQWDKDFMEITPRVSWKHNKFLTVSGYFAYLTVDKDGSIHNHGRDYTRERTRVEVKYTF